MTSKGFTENTENIETPNDIDVTEKPLNSNKISSGRVDINVLKSKVQTKRANSNWQRQHRKIKFAKSHLQHQICKKN